MPENGNNVSKFTTILPHNKNKMPAFHYIYTLKNLYCYTLAARMLYNTLPHGATRGMTTHSNYFATIKLSPRQFLPPPTSFCAKS